MEWFGSLIDDGREWPQISSWNEKRRNGHSFENLKETAAGDARTFNEKLQLEDTHKEVDAKFKKNQEYIKIIKL